MLIAVGVVAIDMKMHLTKLAHRVLLCSPIRVRASYKE